MHIIIKVRKLLKSVACKLVLNKVMRNYCKYGGKGFNVNVKVKGEDIPFTGHESPLGMCIQEHIYMLRQWHEKKIR